MTPKTKKTILVSTDEYSRAKRPAFQTLVALIGVVIILASGLSACTRKVSPASQTQLSATPVVNQKASRFDFGYPSKPPSLKTGKEVFANNCMQCHAATFFQGPKVQKDLAYATPIDLYILLTTGEAPVLKKETDTRKQIMLATGANHPKFVDKLSRDDRWAAVFYARHLAGGGDIVHRAVNNDPDVAAVYGANCAVCHGNQGHGNGFLYTGHPSSHELQGGKVHGGLFYPAPARFTQYDRVYNRTDAQWYKYLAEGIYPSAMPAWLGNVDKDKGYVFNEELLWMLVKHLRKLSYTDDLPLEAERPAGLVLSPAEAPAVHPMMPPVHEVRGVSSKGMHHMPYLKNVDNRHSHMPLLNRKAAFSSEDKPKSHHTGHAMEGGHAP